MSGQFITTCRSIHSYFLMHFMFRAMLHDETNFVDPYAFNPDRYITVDGQLNPDVLDPTAGFGFGRR